MDLDQPFRLLSLLKNLRWDNPDPESRTGSNVVDKALLGFDDKKLEKLLRYIRDWNTNARHARTAQSILHLLLLRLHSSRLLRLPKIKELVDGMIPYSERHYGHAQDLLIASHVVGHTLDQMDNMITVDVDAADVDMGGEVGGRDVEDALGLLGLDEDDDE
ncbi:U3 small nucleolar RNA-associated protein 13 [Irineochytrium annulatum]|nr:U3 small nucleolar RNA-associated protein 13 [Irineochytrium annulatum]